MPCTSLPDYVVGMVQHSSLVQDVRCIGCYVPHGVV